MREAFLRKFKQYSVDVFAYKECKEKSEKDTIRKRLADFQAFINELFKIDLSEYKAIKKLEEELGQMGISFDYSANDNTFTDRVNKLNEKIEKANIVLLDKLKIYQSAFEWRFEFPEVLDSEGNFIGFDAVIANPPYGVMPLKSEKDLIVRDYPVVQKFPDSYCSFIFLTTKILRSGGAVAFIVPNTYCDLESCDEFRKWFLNDINVQMFWQTGFAFDSAVVDTLVFFAENTKRTSDNLSVSVSDDTYVRSISSFLKNDLMKIDYRNTEYNNAFLKSILNRSHRFEDFYSVKAGVKLYEIGKGTPPQSKALVKEKPFTKVGSQPPGWRRLIRGTDINRYKVLESQEFIHYGAWLAAPRDPESFVGDRIVMRRTDDKLLSAFIDDNSVCVNSCHIIKLKSGAVISYKFILALLNSRLIQFLFEIQNPQMVGKTFAEIKVVYISNLPIIRPSDSVSLQAERLVDSIHDAISKNLNTSELERKIDLLMFQLYELSADEVKMIESN